MQLKQMLDLARTLKEEDLEHFWKKFVKNYLENLDAETIVSMHEDGYFSGLVDAEADDVFGTEGVDV